MNLKSFDAPKGNHKLTFKANTNNFRSLLKKISRTLI